MINMNPKYHLLIAVAALSLNACSTDDTCTEPENGGYKISFTVAEDTETRTTLEKLEAGNFMRWVSTDKVGIYTVGRYLNSNILTTADVSKSPVEFAGTLEQPVSPGELFYAYYPYKEGQPTDPSMVKLSIPEVQKQTKAGVYNGESNPLVAVPMGFSELWGSDACCMSNVRFRQLGAIIELQLYSSDEALRSEKIRSVAFESNTPLAGDITFDLTSVTVKDALPISGYESKWVTTLLEEPAAIPATKDGAVRVYLTIAPGRYTGNIAVETDNALYTFCLNKVITFERAAIKGLPADLAEAERDSAVVKTDPIPFKDSTVKDICVKYWDTDQNGELSYEEAAAVTSIESEFMETSIRSFKEFRHFTGLKSIGDKAFWNCSSLMSITIPVRVATIGSQAFWNCSSLINVHIQGNMIEIGSMAFQSCSRLTNILIPDGVTKIRACAFDGCSSLQSINIPEGVTTIESFTFKDCSSLSSVTIPERVTTIGDYAFSGCSSLKSINIPDGVIKIDDYAFYGCSSLTSITLPQELSDIGDAIFTGCSSLSAFYGKYASIDNRYLLRGATLLAFAPAGLTEYKIPDDVIMIGYRAFEDCSSLTNIQIPECVASIGGRAFLGCSSLTSINIPENVVEIGVAAFSGCSNLTSVYCKPTNPPTLGSSAFYKTPSSMQIYVPVASVDAYKAANNWSTYASQIVAENN